MYESTFIVVISVLVAIPSTFLARVLWDDYVLKRRHPIEGDVKP